MTNKLVVIINSLKVPKIKKILLYEMTFLIPNYSCLQNTWLGGYRPQIPVLSVLCPQLNLLNPPNKIPGYATAGLSPGLRCVRPATESLRDGTVPFATSEPSHVPSTMVVLRRSTRFVPVVGSWDPKSTTLRFSAASRTSYTQVQKTALAIHLPSSHDSAADWRYVKHAADNSSAQMSGACSSGN